MGRFRSGSTWLPDTDERDFSDSPVLRAPPGIVMTTTSQSRRISAAPASVWEVLSAFDRICEWAPSVDHSSFLSSKTEGVGARRRIQVGRTTLVETVLVWDVDSTLSYSIDGLPPVLDLVENTWDLTRDGDATMVSLTANVIPTRSSPARLAAKAIVRRLAAANSEMLEALADVAESR